MSERIYIAGALAFCSHALLIGLLNTMATDSRHSAESVSDERTTVTLVDMDLIIEPPTPEFSPTPKASLPPAASSKSAQPAPRLSQTRIITPEPGAPTVERPNPNTSASPTADKSESVLSPQSGPPSPRGLGMRNPSVGPVDVRERGGLAAAIAAADIPRDSQRGDLLSGTPVPELGKVPTFRPSGNGTLTATKQPFKANITQDGRIHFRNKRNIQIEGIRVGPDVPLPMLAGSFDLTDAVMASFGEVLYPYRKLKLMDESRDARALIATEYETEVLREALFGFRKRLTRIWSNAKYGLAERKKLLFLLWDECAESGPTHIVKSARAIRATTLQFIRKKIPHTHQDAYSGNELQSLNATRQSKAKFNPYTQ